MTIQRVKSHYQHMDKETRKGLRELALVLDAAAELLTSLLNHARGGELPSRHLVSEAGRMIDTLNACRRDIERERASGADVPDAMH
ncbi:MAG: hypothetical protein HY749_19255 [Gammaproteobacteria bacterium]|nr:hypothetical protein [Gammaproteobacteria bacterium]